MSLKFFSSILSLILLFESLKAFVPEDKLRNIIEKLEEDFKNADNPDPFGQEGDTFTHEEILKRGLAQSVVKFFYEQPYGPERIKLDKMDDYYKITTIYLDYYGKLYCNLDLIDLNHDVFSKEVVNVDMNANTKDNPYSHFDAEKLIESNRRVIQQKALIFTALQKRNYKLARALTGRILHTVHDFYSHSNWVEMGKREINKLIGTSEFEKSAIVNDINERTCNDNCVRVQVNCDTFSSTVLAVLDMTGTTHIKCPLVYYKCDNNIKVSDKLLSGFYSNQKLDDGTVVDKPSNKLKCSHGGLFDETARREPKGGINKDSAFRLVSPHADLHRVAAELAINHTEHIFNEIRTKIGDVEFVRFLKLEPRHKAFDFVEKHLGLCDSHASSILVSFKIVFISFLVIFLI